MNDDLLGVRHWMSSSLSSSQVEALVKECRQRTDEIQISQKLERAALMKLQFFTYACSLFLYHFFFFPDGKKLFRLVPLCCFDE